MFIETPLLLLGLVVFVALGQYTFRSAWRKGIHAGATSAIVILEKEKIIKVNWADGSISTNFGVDKTLRR